MLKDLNVTNPQLPTRFHIGTQKAGSTYLYNLLASHPDVSLSEQTEVHYYSKYFERGKDWYASLFKKPGVRIDTSPKYFMNGEIVAPLIKEACDEEAKFLLILRNPIDLLNSHYQMHVVSDHFRRHPATYPTVPKSVIECAALYPNYLKQASYYTVLTEHWFRYFKREQFKIVIFERFIKNVDVEMADILNFWNLPPVQLSAERTSQNKLLRHQSLFALRSRIVRHDWLKNALKQSTLFNYAYDKVLTVPSREKITEDERALLAEQLISEVRQLESLLGSIIKEWKDF